MANASWTRRYRRLAFELTRRHVCPLRCNMIQYARDRFCPQLVQITFKLVDRSGVVGSPFLQLRVASVLGDRGFGLKAMSRRHDGRKQEDQQ